ERSSVRITLLQSFPVTGHGRSESRLESHVMREQQRVTDRDIGGSEASAAQILATGQRGFQRPQPCMEPSSVVLSDRGLASFLGLQPRITEHDCLRERERRFAKVQIVQKRAEV